jgi:1-deoxy-D-xylulose-5-phosphate synthase
VCLQNLPVLFAIDRAGVVGSDGPTHHGLFDIAYLRSLPNMIIMAPKNTAELEVMMEWAKEQSRPVAIRYPRGSSSTEVDGQALAPGHAGQPEVALEGGDDVAIVALGPMVEPAILAARELAREGIGATVVNARFVKPLDERFYCRLCEKVKGIVTIEDGVAAGGFGSALLELLVKIKPEKAANCAIIGFPDKYVEHGPRSALLRKYGLSREGIIAAVKKTMHAGVESTRQK